VGAKEGVLVGRRVGYIVGFRVGASLGGCVCMCMLSWRGHQSYGHLCVKKALDGLPPVQFMRVERRLMQESTSAVGLTAGATVGRPVGALVWASTPIMLPTAERTEVSAPPHCD
jgi:hypothetical protein